MNTLALDIGGANIKAAHNSGGAWSLPFALYREPAKLGEMLRVLTRPLPAFERVLMTTTAELCDCFATKREGIERIVAEVELFGAGRPVRIWTTGGRFVLPAQAVTIPMQVGAGNWHAQATMLARKLAAQGLGLLVDTGSTTTDIIRLFGGRADARGATDMARLESGELVYVGARRTPMMAFGPSIEFRGRRYGIMNELFGDLGDVNLLLGHIPEEPGNSETWDRQPFTKRHAAARIVRMIGADPEMIDAAGAVELAGVFFNAARAQISDGIRQVLGNQRPEFVVVSGSGEFLGVAAVRDVLGDKVSIRRLSEWVTADVSEAACAYALLQLDDEA